MTNSVKREWQQPTLEVLSVQMTMGGPHWCNPDANNDGHNNSNKCEVFLDPS